MMMVLNDQQDGNGNDEKSDGFNDQQDGNGNYEKSDGFNDQIDDETKKRVDAYIRKLLQDALEIKKMMKDDP